MGGYTSFMKMQDGAEIFVRKWFGVEKPKGVLFIAHGMAEHSKRYDAFARFCNDLDLLVIANDHRGHGRTGEKAQLMGYFAPQDGFERAVDDLYEIILSVKAELPRLPVFIMGHSMGSFLVRRYVQRYGDTVQAAIFMGSAGKPGPELQIAKLIARLQMIKSPTKPSKLLDKMSFGGYNKAFKNTKTAFDWLSRDEAEVQKYIEDPQCGFVCSSGFFYDLFYGLEIIHKSAEIDKMPKELPLLVINGGSDPVGGSGVKTFVEQLKKHGVERVTSILYPGARHEILNETNRTEVMEDVGAWLLKHVDPDLDQ